MPPSGPFINASYLSEDRHARWLVENLPLKLQIARSWPFLGIAGDALAYARLNTALSGPLPSTDCSAISDVAQTASYLKFPILDFFTRYQLCFRDLDLYNDPTDLDRALYAIAIRQLIYGYFAMLDSAAGGGGLLDYVSATNKVTMAGGALTLDCLDHAYSLVTANEGRPTVIMSSTRGLRLYQKLCRDKGYDAPKLPWAWYDPATGRMEQRLVTEFNGTPWLVNGLMASESSSTATNQRIWSWCWATTAAQGRRGA